jgi:hypothetical protein
VGSAYGTAPGQYGHQTSQNVASIYTQSKQNQLFDKRNDPNFPTALEIEHFQSQCKNYKCLALLVVNSERIKSLSTKFKNERSTLNSN